MNEEDNEDNLDVSLRFSERVKAVISGYKPAVNVNSGVETKIILHDETPVRSSPRRFAPGEKALLEKQSMSG